MKYVIKNNIMESGLCAIYSPVEAYQKTYWFAALTSLFTDTSELVNKKSHARTFHEENSMFYFINPNGIPNYLTLMFVAFASVEANLFCNPQLPKCLFRHKTVKFV